MRIGGQNVIEATLSMAVSPSDSQIHGPRTWKADAHRTSGTLSAVFVSDTYLNVFVPDPSKGSVWEGR